MPVNEKKEVEFSDYLSIIFKWRKLIIMNMTVVLFIATLISFLIPKTYKSTSTLTISSSSSGGMSGLGSLLSGNSALSLGAKLFGVSSSNEDVILGIIGSRNVLTKVINKYDLIDYYSIGDSSIDRTIKAFTNDLIFDANEYGFIEISVIHKEADIAAEMVNYIVNLTDSINVELNIEQAKRNRIYIEKRFKQNQDDIITAEEAFAQFQKEKGVFAVEEQVQVSVMTAAQLEAPLLDKQIILNALKNQVSSDSYLIRNAQSEIDAIKKEIDKNNSGFSSNNLLIPFKSVPDLQIQYLRLYRELEIQNKILEFIYPLYQQALMEENKSIASLVILDAAVPADMKYGPKKAFIILGIGFITFFLMLYLVFKGEKVIDRKDSNNIVQTKEKEFFSWIIKKYKMKF